MPRPPTPPNPDLCARCGSRPRAFGDIYCAKCRREAAEERRRAERALKEAGADLLRMFKELEEES